MKAERGWLKWLPVSESRQYPHGFMVLGTEVGPDPMDVLRCHAQALSMEPGVALRLAHEQGIAGHVLPDDEQGFGMTTHVQSPSLSNGKEMGARMGADFDGLAQVHCRFGPGLLARKDGLCGDFKDGAMLDLELLLPNLSLA